MVSVAVFVFLSLVSSSYTLPRRLTTSDEKSSPCYPFPFVSRAEWGARPAAAVTQQSAPARLVVVHHSYVPRACHSREECARAMRAMQNAHQLTNGWNDIGYNFGVGSDGAVYEGRGWGAVGAHAAGYNTHSVGIVLIGDWLTLVPPKRQLNVVKELIESGVALGHISPQYRLVGHRQLGATLCPGDALFKEISTWERFSTTV